MTPARPRTSGTSSRSRPGTMASTALISPHRQPPSATSTMTWRRISTFAQTVRRAPRAVMMIWSSDQKLPNRAKKGTYREDGGEGTCAVIC